MEEETTKENTINEPKGQEDDVIVIHRDLIPVVAVEQVVEREITGARVALLIIRKRTSQIKQRCC